MHQKLYKLICHKRCYHPVTDVSMMTYHLKMSYSTTAGITSATLNLKAIGSNLVDFVLVSTWNHSRTKGESGHFKRCEKEFQSKKSLHVTLDWGGKLRENDSTDKKEESQRILASGHPAYIEGKLFSIPVRHRLDALLGTGSKHWCDSVVCTQLAATVARHHEGRLAVFLDGHQKGEFGTWTAMWTAKPPKGRQSTALSALDLCPLECPPNVARLPRCAALPVTMAEPERLFSQCVTGSGGHPNHRDQGTTWSYNACSSLSAPSPDGQEVLGSSPKARGRGTLFFEQFVFRGMQHGQVSGNSSTRKTKISLLETKAFYVFV